MHGSTCARAEYDTQLALARDQLAILSAQKAKLVWLRTGCFLIAPLCFFLGYAGESYPRVFQTVAWLATAAFLFEIVRHEHLRLRTLMYQSDERLFLRLVSRLDRDWTNIPTMRLLPEFSKLTVADDLDVAGDASLLSLLSLCSTLPGKQTLQGWIAKTPNWLEVQQRQAAVQLLRERRDLRLSIIKTVMASSEGRDDTHESTYGLPNWAVSPNWLSQHRFAVMLSYFGPVLVAAGLIGLALSIGTENEIGSNVSAIVLGSGFLTNILVTVLWGSWLHGIFLQVTGKHQAAYHLAKVFESFDDLPQDNGLLTEIRRTALESTKSARRGFPRLLWIVRLANLQRSPLMYIAYLALQLLLLWDFRVLKMLERWKTEFGSEVGRWFAALGTCEALISVGTLADEYPDWAYPRPLEDPLYVLKASQIGHPLLPDSVRVPNDCQIEASQALLLVTGSNMSGKSTYLRAVGLNLLLARTGSPVCATLFETHMYELATSIRVRDSLRDGVSYFMAELKRLKEVVDLAESRAQDSSQRVLFLLDEILQGTNSMERKIAVATVLSKLLSFGAVGMVSTHDLDLAHAAEVQAVSQVVHFREHFETQDGKEVMCFDYRMRPGSTPTTNALKLLKIVGLGR